VLLWFSKSYSFIITSSLLYTDLTRNFVQWCSVADLYTSSLIQWYELKLYYIKQNHMKYMLSYMQSKIIYVMLCITNLKHSTLIWV
jgi:hypothetical protein